MNPRLALCAALGVALVPAAVAVDAWNQTAMYEPAEVSTPAQAARRMQLTPTVPPPPTTYVWPGPIPAAYVGLACNHDQANQIAARFHTAGASDDTVVWALRMFSRESGCRWWVRNLNPATGDDSFSLCQLNARAGHFGPGGVLAGWDRWRMLDDFTYAVDACVRMWTICSRGPWTPPYYCSRPAA